MVEIDQNYLLNKAQLEEKLWFIKILKLKKYNLKPRRKLELTIVRKILTCYCFKVLISFAIANLTFILLTLKSYRL